VSLSQSNPERFLDESNILQRMVDKLLNNQNENVSDKDTKLDVLAILSNVSQCEDETAKLAVQHILTSVSEWFDDYLANEEATGAVDEDHNQVEPELHKSMLLLLARAYEYSLKTEDLLELTRGDRILALETVVGVLEDGETYATELVQRAKPGSGQVGQWEHELVTRRHEKPLILQMCRLLKGFTSAPTYFADTGVDAEITLHEVDTFTAEMDNLLEITLSTRLVEKLALALHDVLFSSDYEEGSDDDSDSSEDWDNENEEDWSNEKLRQRQAKALKQLEKGLLDHHDHRSVCGVFAFLQNLYSYAGPEKADVYRQHLLADTLLIPRLVLPYLNRCVAAANLLSRRAETYEAVLNLDCDKEESKNNVSDIDAGLTLDDLPLVSGTAAALRVLIVASFRAPPTRFVLGLLRRLNPTASLLRASSFVARHDYLFALLCLLNVNMGALDLSVKNTAGGGANSDDSEDDSNIVEAYYAHSLLHDMAAVHASMNPEVQLRVMNRVVHSGALPVSRDTPSFSAVKSMLEGGAGVGQVDYIKNAMGDMNVGTKTNPALGATLDEQMFREGLRAEAKQRASDALKNQPKSINENEEEDVAVAESKVEEDEDGEKKKKKKKKKKKREKSDSLLGDLPTLAGMEGARNYNADTPSKRELIELDLELPENMAKKKRKNKKKAGSGSGSGSGAPDFISPSKYLAPAHSTDGGVPEEFACAINGHLMKEPVRTPDGIVFEKATILLWLKTRGSICPITGGELTKDDLEVDANLQAEIVRFHIKKTNLDVGGGNGGVSGGGAGSGGLAVDEDDVYDF